MAKPLILISNDDGYDSPGLAAVVSALADLGELLISAPMTQQSGMGGAWPTTSTGTIYRREINVNGRRLPAFAVDGSPAQSVAHALLSLAPRQPDLAVSGINFGENLGTTVTSSGTVGAAMEAALSGIPSLAVSLQVDRGYYHAPSEEIDFRAASHFTRFFVERVLRVGWLPYDVDLLKVDIPSDATAETVWEIVRQSRSRYFVALKPAVGVFDQPVGVDYMVDATTSPPGTDTYTLAFDRQVAVTPLSVDLTSRTDLGQLEQFLSNGNPRAA
ncbi:MAG: 5'/3'-nucleotidase SurE [Anaerolineae bacterium]|nr:5'/3'-nucleotidase SurE [Anaerolineae bacterium]